jgi:hypothetical protein
MKRLFSDESGYVLVLQRPQILSGARTAAKEWSVELPVREVGVVVEAPSCVVPHCCFYCAWCDHPVLLSNDRIGSPFGNPDARKLDVRSIATVCLHCKHIGSFSMFRACAGYNTRHKITHTANSGETLLLHWLHCIESTCTASVPLFLKIESGEASETMRTEEWLWDELTCASGHTIKQVSLDATVQLPLRTPPGR